MVCFWKSKKMLRCSGLPSSQKDYSKHPKKKQSLVGTVLRFSSPPVAMCVTLSIARSAVVLCLTPGASISSNSVFPDWNANGHLVHDHMNGYICLNQSIIHRLPFRILMEKCLIFNTRPSYKSSCYKANSSFGLAQSDTEPLSKWFLYKQIHHMKTTFKGTELLSCW